MSKYQIAVIVGSLRKDSLNPKLANALGMLEHPELSLKQLQIDAECKPFLQNWMNKYASWVKKFAA
jgi:hypothetical protein